MSEALRQAMEWVCQTHYCVCTWLVQIIPATVPNHMNIKKVRSYKRTNSASCIIQNENEIASRIDPLYIQGLDRPFFLFKSQLSVLLGKVQCK